MTLNQHLINSAIEEWNFFGNQEITDWKKNSDGSFKLSADGNHIPVFKKLGHREEERPCFLRIGEYWTELNLPYNGRNDIPWSASFISFLMKNASLAKSDFLFNQQHSKYIRKAIVSKLKADNSYGFWGYKIEEYAPEVGDLVCYIRETALGKIDYDSSSDDYESHADLVVEKSRNTLKVIGGNVQDSITMKHLELDNNGFLVDKSKKWFVILKNRLKDSEISNRALGLEGRTLIVTGEGVRLRTYPSKTEQPILAVLSKGEEVEYLQISDDKVWSKVKYQDKVGWVSNLYLKQVAAITHGNKIDDIIDIVSKSSIIKYNWKDRGVAPIGYYQGMALMFARLYCRLKKGDEIVAEIAKPANGNPNKDSLTQYEDIFESFGMDNESAGVDTLRHCFVMLTGLGLRESTGRHCVGRDTTAENIDAESAEAGLFQTSYNARKLSPMLPIIFNNYKENPDGFREIFSRQVKPCGNNNWENFGTGNGKEFQQLSKECPGFAVEFTAVAMRNTSRHWGPIINRKVEIKSECDIMFLKVQNYIDKNNIETI